MTDIETRIRDRLKLMDWTVFMEPIVIEDGLGSIDIIPNFPEYWADYQECVEHGNAWDLAYGYDMIMEYSGLVDMIGLDNIEISTYCPECPSTRLDAGYYLSILKDGDVTEIWVTDEKSIISDTRFFHIW